MQDAVLKVPDIHCGHCKMSLEGAVGDLSGVANAEVTIDERTVDVRFDETLTSMDDIVEAIEDQGYEVLSVGA